MELFRRRPLCFFCFLFMITSAIVFDLEYFSKLCIIAFSIVSILIMGLFCAAYNKYKITFLSITLCFLAIVLATANSAFRIDLPRIKANEYIGDRSVKMDVMSVEYVSDNTSTYTVKIDEIDESDVSFKALLVCGFSTDLCVGDTVIADVDIVDMSSRILGLTGEQRSDDVNIVLTAVLYTPEGATVQRFDNQTGILDRLFQRNGFTVVAQHLKNGVTHYIEDVFGDISALVKGFLLGDKSDITTNVIRDFRRSGVSHLFAVSGLHISILLGAVELFLQKLFIPKKARCAIITVLSFFLLFFTGFSMSALRAVFMLWIVYVVFLFAEESDPPTALFLSISMIITIFPYAVLELGMWMSFLATLGLVTVYPIFEDFLRKAPKKSGALRILLKIIKAILLTLAMTVIANMFLLPIQWKIFGEISAVSIIANVLLSPLSAVFLISSAITLIIGKIPILGSVAVAIVKLLGALILRIVEKLSALDIATVSLRYFFANILVVAFTISMIILLLVKLKHKWTIVLPILCFSLVFGVSVAAFELTAKPEITYYGQNNDETFAISSGRTLGIVDMSDGSYSGFSQAIINASEKGATSVEYIVFTTIGKGHISAMEYFFRSNVVDRIYIAEPSNEEERQMAVAMATLAKNSKVDSYLYRDGEILKIDGISMCFYTALNGTDNATAMFVSAGKEILGYADTNVYNSDFEDQVNEKLSKCDTVIIGNNDTPDDLYRFSVKFDANVVYASKNIMDKSDIFVNYQNCYYSDTQKTKLTFELK